ncbi:MAG: ABC transporter ATP-binding protein [Calditrichaeota bacterium]|nr:MAG: ABC transporter ATP-binding protein [Calditrichota bacterium]MBL1207735.1 ABC transporter ATP-binding protein [Calditrichota bacterium]NOG47569.1 ABC transporter ATP-binding protein [Calditrichota bacterium]
MKINIRELSKIYPNKNKALDNVSFEISDGLFGLLGPNGAGKSTLMRILVTLMKPTKGSVTIDGFDLQKNRKEIRGLLGYLPQDFSTFPKIKTWEFLDYSARLAGLSNKKKRIQKIDLLLEKVGLFDSREKLASKLSGGMKRRVGIAQALINDPKILIVDEPTTGLDPEERIRFRNLLTEMSRDERIIILSTHIVGDISSTCHDMALLSKGSLAFKGAPKDLIEQAVPYTYQLEVDYSELEKVKQEHIVISTVPVDSGWQVDVVAKNINGFKARQIEPNLEHAYVCFMELLN